MIALLEQKPQRILQEKRLAREIVRALYACGIWMPIEGKDPGISDTFGIKFPTTPHKDVTDTVHELSASGLLTAVSVGCGGRNWCFESEIICKPSSHMMDANFSLNSRLRDALVSMLKPFESERPRYVIDRYLF